MAGSPRRLKEQGPEVDYSIIRCSCISQSEEETHDYEFRLRLRICTLTNLYASTNLTVKKCFRAVTQRPTKKDSWVLEIV